MALEFVLTGCFNIPCYDCTIGNQCLILQSLTVCDKDSICVPLFQAHDTSVRAMQWSHNDMWMVTADHAGFIKYWQTNMNNVKMYQGHKEAVRGIRWAKGHNSGFPTSKSPRCRPVQLLLRTNSSSVFVYVDRCWASISVMFLIYATSIMLMFVMLKFLTVFLHNNNSVILLVPRFCQQVCKTLVLSVY